MIAKITHTNLFRGFLFFVLTPIIFIAFFIGMPVGSVSAEYHGEIIAGNARENMVAKFTSEEGVRAAAGQTAAEALDNNEEANTQEGQMFGYRTRMASISAGKRYAHGEMEKSNTRLAIRVFTFSGSSVNAFTADAVKGLERVYALRSAYQIASINLSIGKSASFTDRDSRNFAAVKSAIEKLLFVKIVAAADNNPSTLLAAEDGNTSAYSLLAYDTSLGGNSMAYSHVTSTSMMVSSALPYKTAAEVLEALQNGNVPAAGAVSNFSRKWLNPEYATREYNTLQTVLGSPSGAIGTKLPTFMWGVVSGATAYHLQVCTVSKQAVIEKTYSTPSSICNGSTCSAASPNELQAGDYTWRVNVTTDGGNTWSDSLAFSVSVPGQATLLSPSGDNTNLSPTFSWNKVDLAQEYLLYIYKMDGSTAVEVHRVWYTAENADCGAADSDGVCQITPPITLGAGTHTWKIRTRNPVGAGAWSSSLTFTNPSAPGQVTTIAPSGISGTWSPTYSWNKEASSQSYQLYIYKTSGTTTTAVYNKWYTAEDADCGAADSDGICQITPPITLGAGPYYWKVRGKNAVGVGAWSKASSFATPAKPGQVTIIAPSGISETWSPTYSWNKEASSQSYQLYIYKKVNTTVTTVHKVWYTAEDAVCDDDNVCEITPPITLGDGTYYWKVRGKNPSGGGAWSATLSFNTPAKPGQVTLLSPLGTSSSATPEFSWETEASSQSYQLFIYQKSGTTVTTIYKVWYTADDAGCGDGSCEVTPGISLEAGNYYWKVRGKNPSGSSAWSGVGTFTIATP